MSGTVQTPSYLMSVEIVDNTSQAIIPANIRDCVESLASMVPVIKTAAYTYVLTDRGTVIEMNITGSTLTYVTVPTNASVAFSVGAMLAVRWVGAAPIGIVGASGVTVDTASSLTLRARWSTAFLNKRATNEWVASGDLT